MAEIAGELLERVANWKSFYAPPPDGGKAKLRTQEHERLVAERK